MAKIASMNHRSKIIRTIDKIVDVYENNSKNVSLERANLLRKTAMITELVLKFGIILYISVALFLLGVPIFAYFWQNELRPMYLSFLPFIDETTYTGFAILTLYHIIGAYGAIVGSGCVDFLFPMLVVNVPIFTTIFYDEIREMNEVLKKRERNARLVKMKLRRTIAMFDEIQK